MNQNQTLAPYREPDENPLNLRPNLDVTVVKPWWDKKVDSVRCKIVYYEGMSGYYKERYWTVKPLTGNTHARSVPESSITL